MKNIDMLLQRMEVFEKLAVYGDRSSFLRAIAIDISERAFPSSTLSQSLNAIANRLNILADAWEKTEAKSISDANNLRVYARGFQSAAIPYGYTSREKLNDKINDLKRFRNNTVPLLKKVNPTLASQTTVIQEELNRIEPLITSFMRNELGLPYSGDSSETPSNIAAPTQEPAKPKPQVPMSTLAKQLSTRMTNFTKQRLGTLPENDPKRAAVVKQIENMASQLKRMHDRIKSKPNQTLEDRFALIGISTAFTETYNMLGYEDLQKAPTFDYGRSSAFEQE